MWYSFRFVEVSLFSFVDITFIIVVAFGLCSSRVREGSFELKYVGNSPGE